MKNLSQGSREVLIKRKKKMKKKVCENEAVEREPRETKNICSKPRLHSGNVSAWFPPAPDNLYKQEHDGVGAQTQREREAFCLGAPQG